MADTPEARGQRSETMPVGQKPATPKPVDNICPECNKGVLVVAEVRKRPFSRLLRCTENPDCNYEVWRATTQVIDAMKAPYKPG